jgi:hypothetical protein
LTGAAVASDTVRGMAMAPTPAAAEAVSSFVDRYAVRETRPGLRNPLSVATTARATNVTLYPTADSEAVFVSFRIGGAERIALAETHEGRVTRFTDFTGIRPRIASVETASSGDAQEQARSILSPTSSAVVSGSARLAPNKRRTGAQQQAADLLQFASVKADSAERSQIASRDVAVSVGDSHQIACTSLDSHNSK